MNGRAPYGDGEPRGEAPRGDASRGESSLDRVVRLAQGGLDVALVLAALLTLVTVSSTWAAHELGLSATRAVPLAPSARVQARLVAVAAANALLLVYGLNVVYVDLYRRARGEPGDLRAAAATALRRLPATLGYGLVASLLAALGGAGAQGLASLAHGSPAARPLAALAVALSLVLQTALWVGQVAVAADRRPPAAALALAARRLARPAGGYGLLRFALVGTCGLVAALTLTAIAAVGLSSLLRTGPATFALLLATLAATVWLALLYVAAFALFVARLMDDAPTQALRPDAPRSDASPRDVA